MFGLQTLLPFTTILIFSHYLRYLKKISENFDIKIMAKKSLIYIAILIGKIIIINFAFPHFLNFTFKFCRTCVFTDNVELSSLFRPPPFFATIYSLIGFYLNFKTMGEFSANSYFAIIGLSLLDILLIQLSMIFCLVYFSCPESSFLTVSAHVSLRGSVCRPGTLGIV